MTNLEFKLGKKAIYQAIEDSNEFLKIVVFQLTSREIVNLLIKKAKEGIKIDIITLPEDSFAKVEERKTISGLYDILRDNGIKLNLCSWEVGDPSLTATSLSGEMAEGGGSKWYSLHGKFLMNEKYALISSANLTDEEQWEIYLRLDKEWIDHFNEKYNQLFSLFIARSSHDMIDGKIFDVVTEDIKKEIIELWEKSNRKNIAQYPPEISPKSVLKKGLHISPFDGRARDILYEMITQAHDIIYISSERLYDNEVVNFLKKKALTSKIDIQVITGHPRNVRQNPSKAESYIIELLASNVNFGINNIHAKFWLTEKWLMVGSPNLTKMNLGFGKSHDFWRSNTEILFLTDEPTILSQARKEFESLLSKSVSGITAISDTTTKLGQAKDIFGTFNARSRENARLIMSRIETRLSIKSRSDIIRIARVSVGIANRLHESYVDDIHVIMAIILFYLQERKHSRKELEDKMKGFIEQSKINISIEYLVRLGYCIFQEDMIMINLEKVV